MNCEPDYKFPGLCAAHGSVFRGAVCEAVLIQRVRELHRTGPGDPTPGGSICWCCGNPWPCLTVQALDTEEDERE